MIGEGRFAFFKFRLGQPDAFIRGLRPLQIVRHATLSQKFGVARIELLLAIAVAMGSRAGDVRFRSDPLVNHLVGGCEERLRDG
jgi:hypothetical protein